MPAQGLRPLVSTVLIAFACLLAAVRPAAAQYNAQILLPPSGLDQAGWTHGFAMNESGQVLGEVVSSPTDRRLVLWTDGVGAELPLPDGYYWRGGGTGYDLLNNSGIVVSQLRIANGVPNSNFDESRVVVWQNGVPQVLPPPDSCAQSDTGHQFVGPWGLNNLGHILVGTFGDNACGRMWLWDGSGYQMLFDINTPPAFGFTLRLTHLNDADHVVIDRFPGSPTCDSNGTITGFLTGTQFTSITGGSALQINNHDQVFLYCTIGGQQVLKLWDGTTLVNLGFGGAASMNERGDVVFQTGVGNVGVPKIYKDGVVSDLQLPMFPQTLGIDGGSLINSSGQIVISEVLMLPGGGVTDQAVMFTPRTPVITWPNPAPIIYGTALGPTELNATANVPGTFVYTPPAGTVLNAGPIHLLSLTFTPSNLALYDPTTASNSIGVQSAPLTVKADDASKEFGAPVPALSASFIGLVNGDGPGNLLGSLTLTTGATSASPAGTYPIVPSSVSSPNYLITFVSGTLTINRASTTTTLQVLPATTGYLQANALIAQVARTNPGLGSPGGMVRFRDGTTVIGSAGVSAGQAYILANGLTPGTHSLTAEYLGTANFAGSSAAPGTATIRPIANSTFTVLTVTTNPRALGLPATLTARVAPLAGGTPTGTVRFSEGSTVLGNASVVAGVATLNTTAIGAGTHVLKAKYFGNATFAPSTSPPAIITIYTGARPATTSVALAASPSPATLGQPLTFTATVTGGATTGTVYFYADGLFVGAAAIANSGGSVKARMTLTTGALSAGRHVLSAVYLGAAGFASSTAPVQTLTIQTAPALHDTADDAAPPEEGSTPTP